MGQPIHHGWFLLDGRRYRLEATKSQKRKNNSRTPRFERFEDRRMLSVSVEVLDPVIEPGQDVAVLWEVARSYVDTDASGAIEEQEVNSLTVVLDILGGIKNQVEFIPALDADCYINSDGNLVGIATVPMPVDAPLGATYSLWATADNGVDLPIAGKSAVPVSLASDEASSGAGALASPFSANYRTGLFGAPVTELYEAVDFSSITPAADTTRTIAVVDSTGFPIATPFDIWISGANYLRATVQSRVGNVWQVVYRESGPVPSAYYGAGSRVTLDPIDTYAMSSGISRESILDYAETINGPPNGSSAGHADRDIADETVRSLIARAAAIVELRAAHALNDEHILDGDITKLKNKLPDVLNDVFKGYVRFAENTPWNPNLPTVVMVHGIRNTPFGNDGFLESIVDRIGSSAKGMFNVLGFTWGCTDYPNGLDRSIGDVLTDAIYTNDKGSVLQAAVNLNKVFRYLDRSYEQAGADGSTKVSVIAHSEGSVVTTAAMSLDATELNASFAYRIKQALFVGGTLEDTGSDLFNIFPMFTPDQWPIVTNLHSASDLVLHLSSLGGGAVALGYQGVRMGVNNPIIGENDFNADALDEALYFGSFFDEDGDVDVVHTGGLRTSSLTLQLVVGWWDWLRMMQEQRLFVQSGLVRPDGFAGVAREIIGQGTIFDAVDLPISLTGDIPIGYGPTTGTGSISPLPPQLSDVHFASGNGSGSGGGDSVGTGSGGTPDLTVNQGDYFIAEAVGAVDPDGYIFRADFYRDVNGNGLPDDNDQEYLGTDFHSGNGWKRAIYTADWALGTYDIIAQVFDNGGNASNIKVATVQVVDPTLPPGPLPVSFDNSQQPQYNIIPHRNGDVSYDPALFKLVPGRMDIWQITPQTGGGFNFETTGDSDTVLGLYDWANGNLLVVDEDNGLGNNAEVTYTLTAGHTYVLIVASQRGDSGAYGLDVTGANQTITATPGFPAPLYEAAVAESIATPFELDYFKATVPATTTTLNVVLDVGTALNGWVRIENAAHETLATAFLAGLGDDESLSAVDVTPGEEVFVTVAALEGTTGSYTLRLDFGPDEPGLPGTMDPPPTDGIRLVPKPDGTFTLSNQSIATPGQFRSYQFSAHDLAGGQYTFETFGDLDTQIGVYLRHSQSNSTLIATDDDSGGGENARLAANLNAGDDYIVIVRGEGTDTGEFELSVSGPELDPINLVVSGLALEYTNNYQFLGHDDRFYHYAVVAPDNATILTVQAEIQSLWPDLDVSLRVSDTAGNILATAEAGGPGTAETISNLAIAGGETYFITVYSEDYTIGNVRIHVDFNPDFAVEAGAEFPINTLFDGEQDFPDVARNSSGQSVVVWRDNQVQRISAQRFDANGQPVGGEFQIAGPFIETAVPTGTIVGIADNGNFVVIYGPSKYRIFGFDGTPLTTELDIGISASARFDVAVDPNGEFFIVGTTGGGIGGGQLIGRLFDASGNPLTGPLVLDDTADDNSDPAVAAVGNGNFIVTWRSATGGPSFINDVYAIRVDSSGNVIPSGRNTYVRGSLAGRRFDDLDGDGSQDPDEVGVEGVTVLLDADGDGTQDMGEPTQVTDLDGNYSFTNVPEGIYSVVPITGPPSGPAPFVDDFNRTDDTNLGADWTEISGDVRIADGRLRTAGGSGTHSAAIYEPFDAVDQYVVFDVDYTATGAQRTAGVYLAYNDPNNFLRIELQDYSEGLGFRNVVFAHRAYGFSGWPRMSGGDYHELVPVFTTGRIFAGYDSASHTITLGIDADFDGTYETVLTRGGISPDGLGTKVGIAAWNDVAIDNFTVNPNARVVPSVVASPTEAFLVAPGLDRVQLNPVVASPGDGTFAIAFEGWLANGTDGNIYAQRFDMDAAPEGDVLLVNSEVAGNQFEPSVALLSQGKFLVAWEGNDTNGRGIRAQQLGVNLERLGPEFTLNLNEVGTQQNVALASDGNERVVAVWEGPDANFVGIYGLDFTLAEVQEPELTVTDIIGDPGDRFVDFGSQVAEVGGTVTGFMPATITIKNDGNAPLIVDSIDVYGADATAFQLSDASAFTLSPGESRIINVTFIGTDLGEYYAAVRLDHNDNSDVLSGDFDADRFWVSVLAKIETPFQGDYDESGTVAELDYSLWKSSYGDSGNGLPADGNHDSVVDAADYTVWRNNLGASLFPPPELPGDYNRDSAVDAADYTVWRNSLGLFVTRYSGADGDGNEMIEEADYVVWKANYGHTLPPENASATTMVLQDEPPIPTGSVVSGEVSDNTPRDASLFDLRTVGPDFRVASSWSVSPRTREVVRDVSGPRPFLMQHNLMAALMDSLAVKHRKTAIGEAASASDSSDEGTNSYFDAVDRVFENVGTKHAWVGVDSLFR